MTSLEPARDAVAQERESVSIRFELDGGEALLRLTPGTAGLNAFHLEVSDTLVGPETRAVLKIILPAREGMTTKDLHLSRAPDGTFTYRGSELGMSGEWAFELVLRQQGSASISASNVQAIASPGLDADRSGAPWRFAPVGGLAGLLLTLIGIGGIIVAIVARTGRMRRVSVAIGLAGLMLGIVLLVQARIDPGPEAAEVAATGDPGGATMVARGETLNAEHCLALLGAELRGDGAKTSPWRRRG
jgi:hypothetical protein